VAYTLQPWQVLRAAIDFLREENRVLLEQLGDRRIRLTNVAAVVFTSPA